MCNPVYDYFSMRLEIKIFDDQDQVVAEYKGDPSQPGGWRADPSKRLVSKMPQQSDNQNTGTYELFGFSYQPHLAVNRPNGYTAPVPSPNNGLPANFPNIFSPRYGDMLKPKSSPWSPMAPTVTPAQGGSPASNLNQEVKQ